MKPRYKFWHSIWLLFSIISIVPRAWSTSSQGFNAFVGAGINFTMPGTLRVGYGDWEGGLLSTGIVGLSKHFSYSENIYSSFGFGTNVDGSPSGLGFQVGIGFHYGLFWGLGLRGEFIARTNTNGAGLAHGLIGLAYGF